MVGRLITGVVLVSVAGISLAGCGGKDPKTAADGPEVAWAGRVCSAVGAGGAKLTLPHLDPKNPQKQKESLIVFLGTVSTQLKTLKTSLEGQGAPQVTGGKASYDRALSNLSETQAGVDSAATSLRASKVSDPASLKHALDGVGKSLVKFSAYEGPSKDLRTNPELNKAFTKAPACQRIHQ
ncbi:hypothetical protein ACRYCC_23800 [Actinomadura scrupuli]|uniref:hypothetical protein n=1 Tax=Actinomadura scrupuli TaxID=559629 RepID=UPI003D97E96E